MATLKPDPASAEQFLRRFSMKEIAERIDAHLKRMEDDPKINRYPEGHPAALEDGSGRPLHEAGAYARGSWIEIIYLGYQGRSTVRKGEAIRYLDALNRGHTGRHFAHEIASWQARHDRRRVR